MSAQSIDDTIEIAGTTASAFQPVLERFAANFRRNDESREVGAALTVFRGDQCVVDIWGGTADAAATRPWRRDTLLNVYSTTKGFVAACVGMLVDRGLLRYEDKVAKVWPEFAQAGKGDVTVAQLMSHQAGLPAFDAPVTLETFYDWDACCATLAAQPPRWTPGEKTGYQPVTFGYLAGEVVRRVTGKTVGKFLASEIGLPLQADIYIGLPASQHARVAETIKPKTAIDPAKMVFPPETNLALTNPMIRPNWANTPAWREAEMPALNGHASAHGVATLYSLLVNGGSFEGRRLLSPATIQRMTAVQAERMDLTLGMDMRWACGFALNNAAGFFGPGRNTFGHSGWGGSFGCADPDTGIAIGYVCNQMGAALVGDVRALELCAAVYECL